MIKIIADTTSSIAPEEAEQLGIPLLPQIIIFGDQSYRDDCEMNSQQFLQKLRTSPVLPKTSAPQPVLYAPIYERFASEGHTMIVVAPSSDVSGTYRSASVAAQDFPDADIRVVDTRTIAGGLGNIVRVAHGWAQAGKSADEILAGIKEMVSRERLYFVVDTLEYLYKGGRIGGAAALVGSLLQVKPVLTVRDGHIETFEKQRTHKVAIARLKELILTECPKGDPEGYLTIMHGDAEAEAVAILEEMRTTLELKNVRLCDLPPAILTHSGPGPIAVSFFVK